MGINICLDCFEIINEGKSSLHNNCKNKINFELKKFKFEDKKFDCIKIKENIYFKFLNSVPDTYELKLIKTILNKSFNKKALIMAFKNKKDSNSFVYSNIKEINLETFNSGWTYIQDSQMNRIILLNRAGGLDNDSMDLIFDLIFSSINIKITKSQREEIFKNFVNILFEYNKSCGIEFVTQPEEISEMSQGFVHEVVAIFNLYHILKEGLKRNPTQVKNYIKRLYFLHKPEKINKEPNFYEVLSNYLINFKLSILLLVVKGLNQEQMISEELKKHREIMFNFKNEYNELKNILNFLFDDITEDDLIKIEFYFKKIKKDIDYLIDNLSPIYERLQEILLIVQMLEEILFKIQFNKSKKMLIGSADVFGYLTKLSLIEKKCKCKTMLFLIKQAEFELLAEYTIISKDITIYTHLKEKCGPLFRLGYDLINNQTSSMVTESLRLDDIILLWNRMSYVSFCLGNLKEFYEFREKFYSFIKTNKVSPTLELGYLSTDFWMTEDYKDLIKILEIYEGTVGDNFFDIESDKKKELESVFLLSKSFLDLNLNNKINYLTKALKLVEEFPLMPGSLQRDSTVIAHQKRNISLLIHLWKFIKEKDNSFFGFIELENAIEYAKDIVKNTQIQDNSRRFALKILIIKKVLTDDYNEEVEKLIRELKEYHNLEKDSFVEQIKELVNFIKSDKKEALKLFLKKEAPSNLWERIIYKLIQSKAKQFYLGFIEQINELKSLNSDELLNKFKLIVERDAVTSFWKNKTTPVEGNPEDIGRNMLLVFLRALDLDPSKEEQLGYKKREDVIVRNFKDKKLLIETKMGTSKSYVLEGIDKIKEYCKLERASSREIYSYYIIFILKNNESEFEDEYPLEEDKKIKVIKVLVRPN